jgi:hypothetical protein
MRCTAHCALRLPAQQRQRQRRGAAVGARTHAAGVARRRRRRGTGAVRPGEADVAHARAVDARPPPSTGRIRSARELRGRRAGVGGRRRAFRAGPAGAAHARAVPLGGGGSGVRRSVGRGVDAGPVAAAVAGTHDLPIAEGRRPAGVAHAGTGAVAVRAGRRARAVAGADDPVQVEAGGGRRGGWQGDALRAGVSGLADARASSAGAVSGAVGGARGDLAGVRGPPRVAEAGAILPAGAVAGAAVGADGGGAVVAGEPRGA